LIFTEIKLLRQVIMARRRLRLEQQSKCKNLGSPKVISQLFSRYAILNEIDAAECSIKERNLRRDGTQQRRHTKVMYKEFSMFQ